VYSWLQRLRSLRHGFSYGVGERVRWSRGVFHETPAEVLAPLPSEQARRIALLQRHYQARFESSLGEVSSRNNYEYLDVLDRAWSSAGIEHAGGVVCDVGCASFWYAAALSVFFRPDALIGVEVEGHRLFKGGYSRLDYARGYVSRVPNAEFVVADYSKYLRAADVITAWFPFLTPNAILAWRLPLSLLAPERLLRQIRHNLRPGGRFFMVNHGPREAQIAADLCHAAGLAQAWTGEVRSVFGPPRLEPPIASIWRPLAPGMVARGYP
jgi:SAM-dependent methyltransferase